MFRIPRERYLSLPPLPVLPLTPGLAHPDPASVWSTPMLQIMAYDCIVQDGKVEQSPSSAACMVPILLLFHKKSPQRVETQQIKNFGVKIVNLSTTIFFTYNSPGLLLFSPQLIFLMFFLLLWRHITSEA